MTQETHDLLQKALALSESERAELAGNLLSSLDTTVDPDVDAAWQDEVARRMDEVQSGKVKTIPWPEVRERNLAKLPVAAEDARLFEAVKLGEESLDRGEYLTQEQVAERLDHLFRS